MKRINQFERTDRDITEAFLNILMEKSFDKITTQDIIKEAMVSRSTFYQHFPDKYAILEKLNEKYVTELTEIVYELRKQNAADLKQMDQIIQDYFLKNRRVLRILFHIKTEYMDIAGQFRKLFIAWFQGDNSGLSDLEAYLMSGLFLDFFIYYLDNEMDGGHYSTMFFECCYKLSLYFFQLEQKPDAQKAFRELLDTYARKE